MTDLFDSPDAAATPLTAEEKRDLRPSYITYRNELNEAEQDNILRGEQWALSRRRELLDEGYIKALHRNMLGDVWRWAGKFRTSARNLGIDYWQIPVALRLLLEDSKACIALGTCSPDEIAVRLHHRMVQIHPFPNGNGRHSRLMADLMAMELGRDRFSWGRQSLRNAGAARQQYIDALHAADEHDIRPLLLFSRA